MKQQFDDAEIMIDEAIAKMKTDNAVQPSARKVEGMSPVAEDVTPGDIVTASELALLDMKDMLTYFRNNFLDKNGKFIKISFWSICSPGLGAHG